MGKKIRNSPKEEPALRLFKSDFLEFFTHISPLVVLAVFIPIFIYLIVVSARVNPGALWWRVLLGIVIGFIIWTPTEYALHRFLFHFQPKVMTPQKERILFLMHGVHHSQPRCKTRLVMPPVASIPMAAVFYLFFWLIIGKLFGAPFMVNSVMAGFLIGYLMYDMTHYALHHVQIPGEYWKKLRVHHMNHHFLTHDQRFGVSSWICDDLFGTNPPDSPKDSSKNSPRKPAAV